MLWWEERYFDVSKTIANEQVFATPTTLHVQCVTFGRARSGEKHFHYKKFKYCLLCLLSLSRLHHTVAKRRRIPLLSSLIPSTSYSMCVIIKRMIALDESLYSRGNVPSANRSGIGSLDFSRKHVHSFCHGPALSALLWHTKLLGIMRETEGYHPMLSNVR